MKADVPMTLNEFLDACFGIHHCGPPSADARHLTVNGEAPGQPAEVDCRCRREGNLCPGCAKTVTETANPKFQSVKKEK